jgi:hypothetical protein
VDTYSVSFLRVPEGGTITVDVRGETREKAIKVACRKLNISRHLMVGAVAHNPMPGGGQKRG